MIGRAFARGGACCTFVTFCWFKEFSWLTID